MPTGDFPQSCLQPPIYWPFVVPQGTVVWPPVWPQPVVYTCPTEPRAVLCPVCSGSGKVKTGTPVIVENPCHGCEGKGWVKV